MELATVCFCLLPLLAVSPAADADDHSRDFFSKAACDFSVDLLKPFDADSRTTIASPTCIDVITEDLTPINVICFSNSKDLTSVKLNFYRTIRLEISFAYTTPTDVIYIDNPEPDVWETYLYNTEDWTFIENIYLLTNRGLTSIDSQSNTTEGNVILSPSSVGILLSILQQGARGATGEQLETVLRMTPEQSKLGHSFVLKSLQREKANVTLEWGTRAYVRPGFEILDAFNETIRDNFGATIQELNFVEPSPNDAALVINNWVKEITRDNIKHIVPPSLLTSDTVLVLLNAVYFKGLWDVPFAKVHTKTDKFETSPDNSVPVPFMHQEERFIAGEDPDSGLTWLDLPFKDEQFSMLFLLPSERHGLSQVLEKMTGSLLRKIIDDDQTRQVTVTIPKFNLQERVLLARPLQQLGLIDIFTEDSNLEGIASNYQKLRVSKVLHEASVEIDESGSTASAATGFLHDLLSFPKSSDHLKFTADHPFFFFLLDRYNKIPLFAGIVTNPS